MPNEVSSVVMWWTVMLDAYEPPPRLNITEEVSGSSSAEVGVHVFRQRHVIGLLVSIRFLAEVGDGSVEDVDQGVNGSQKPAPVFIPNVVLKELWWLTVPSEALVILPRPMGSRSPRDEAPPLDPTG